MFCGVDVGSIKLVLRKKEETPDRIKKGRRKGRSERRNKRKRERKTGREKHRLQKAWTRFYFSPRVKYSNFQRVNEIEKIWKPLI